MYPLLPDVRSRRLVFYDGENQKIPRSSAGSLRLRRLHCLSAVSPPASPTSCASRSRGTSVVFRRPLHGHVHVSAQHDRWIKLRRCRSVTVAQSVWVCLVAFSSQYSCFLFVYFCQPTSVDSCTLHALCQTPKSGSRRELLLPSRAPFIHPA